MSNVVKNIRKLEVDSNTGKNACDTKVTSGEAKITSAFKEKNSTTGYSTSGKLTGPFGGMNTND